MRRTVFALLAAACMFAVSARAEPLDEFNAAVERFNAPYKATLFYLRTGNAGVAGLEFEQALASWREVASLFAASPPEKFSRDAKTIDEISSILAAAEAEIAAGDAKPARARLLPITTTLHTLRSRNGVRVLADCIYELRPHMDVLYAFRRAPEDLSSADVRKKIGDAAKAYIDKTEQCRGEVPDSLANKADFDVRLQDAAQSIQLLKGDLEEIGQTRVINSIRQLRSHDAFIYLRWG